MLMRRSEARCSRIAVSGTSSVLPGAEYVRCVAAPCNRVRFRPQRGQFLNRALVLLFFWTVFRHSALCGPDDRISQEPPPEPKVAVADAITNAYRVLLSMPTTGELARAVQSIPVERIQISRSGARNLDVVYYRNGNAILVDGRNKKVQRARMNSTNYIRLCHLLVSLDLLTAESLEKRHFTDGISLELIIRSSGEEHLLYRGEQWLSSIEVWAIMLAMEGLTTKLKWVETELSPEEERVLAQQVMSPKSRKDIEEIRALLEEVKRSR